MKLINYIISSTFGCALSLMMGSCAQEEIDLYSGPKAGIFIQEVYKTDLYGNPLSYTDCTTGLTFANYDANTTVLNTRFDVRAIGAPTDYDRPYRLVLDPEQTTAVEDVDFSLEGNEFTIKAGESTDRVRVKLLRNNGLLQRTVRIYFRLEPNEHFDMPVTEYKNAQSWSADGDMISTDHFYIEFGEKYVCPSYWTSFGTSYFGSWTVTKYLTLNAQMGWTVRDWSNAGFTGAKVAYGRLPGAAKILQTYLQQQADAGNPIADPDDPTEYVQLGNGYKVDYSAYISTQD